MTSSQLQSRSRPTTPPLRVEQNAANTASLRYPIRRTMAQPKYLYDQRGPWPQPNSLDYRLYPAVMHLPLSERFRWTMRIGLRYVRQAIFYTPRALIYGLMNPSAKILSDREFEERFNNTVFNKMVVPFSPEAAQRESEVRAHAAKPTPASNEPTGAPPPQLEELRPAELESEALGGPMPPGPSGQTAPRPGELSTDWGASVPYQMPVSETQQMLTELSQQQAARMAHDRFPEQMAQMQQQMQQQMPAPPDRGDARDGDASRREPTGRSTKKKPKPVDRFFIADFSIFEDVPTYPNTYVAATTALFKRDAPGARLDVVSIRVNDLTLTPEDGDAWELAKLFTMQAASLRLVFSTHALLHFPDDSINAITKDRLPTNHVLFQLLYPHTPLQLVLDHVVQTSSTSPLLNHQIFPWNAAPGPFEGQVQAAVKVYGGVEGNPAYPPYHYKHPRRTKEEKYVNFLEAYYQAILRFVRKVLARVDENDELVKVWADYVALYVPGFPDGENIFEMQDEAAGIRNLDWAVATFIWDVSVGHTTDHYNMGLLDINENPLRLHVPPPSSKDATFDRRDLRKWTDFFRYRLFWRMFLTSATVYRLDKVRYPFTDPQLQAYAKEFIADLKKTAASQTKDEFIPLKDIACSVQF